MAEALVVGDIGEDESFSVDSTGINAVLAVEDPDGPGMYMRAARANDAIPPSASSWDWDQENRRELGDLSSPELSPDGLTVYFDSARDGMRNIFFASRASTGVMEEILAVESLDAANESSFNDSDPTVTSDGNTLIFVSDRSGSPRLYTLDVSQVTPP